MHAIGRRVEREIAREVRFVVTLGLVKMYSTHHNEATM